MDKPYFTELFSDNYPSFPKQNNNNRLLRFRMGDMVRERSFSRTLVKGRNKMAHKFRSTDDRFYRSEVVCERSTLSDSHQSLDGQYDCLSLYKPHRRNSFCQSCWLSTSGSGIGKEISTFQLFTSPGQLNLIADILSRLISLNSEWKLSPAVFHQVCVIYTAPDLDLFATRANNQLQKFISCFPDPDAPATNAFTILWSNQLWYAFSLYSLITP